MAVGKSFFDQYSVFCVFGSVVGCVVVPLITQSVESVIFSAIVISLTATHLTRRNSISENPGKNAKEEKKKKDNQSTKKRKKAPVQHQQHSPTRQVVETRPRKKRDDSMKKVEELKMLEQERKELEKKERKTKKKEEREIRKEEERVIKERELQKLQNMKEQKDKSKTKQAVTTNSEKTKSMRSTTQSYTKKQDKATSLSKLDTLLTRPLVTDAKLRQRTSSCSDNNDEQLSPPPSVWKVPEYTPPKWNPGQPEGTTEPEEGGYTKHVPPQHHPLNNDSEHSRPKTKPVQPFNQLYNHTTNMQANFKNQYMNQEVKRFQESFLQHSETSSFNLKECWSKADNDLYKPDNRQFFDSSYDSPPISEMPTVLHFLHSDYAKESSAPSSKEYTLFGPEEPNRSIFTPPNLSSFGHV